MHAVSVLGTDGYKARKQKGGFALVKKVKNGSGLF